MEVIKVAGTVLAALVVTLVLTMLFSLDTAQASDSKVELYYFGIDNCYFCTLQKPLIMQLNANGFNFEIINATYPTPRVQVLLDKYTIYQYPTIIIIKKDGWVIRLVGFRPLKVIREALQ
ncbi:hypothetical protein LCGC14_0673710 [marine sediment metagenome]|uniref:Thioredoxin domain-containing protein n=1 Tax=marine sediment metagenome TaxID=412755 RepID=A0A0F9TY76_9ZZZZ